MISFPAFLVAKEAGEDTDWVTIQLNDRPHLVIFSASDKAAAFIDALPKEWQYTIREFPGSLDLRRELLTWPRLAECVIDYEAGAGTQRAIRGELLLRWMRVQ